MLVVGGIGVRFTKLADEGYSVVRDTDGKTLGILHWLPSENAFHALAPDGRVLQQPSPWGGRVSARFGTRELATRALLDEEKRSPDS